VTVEAGVMRDFTAGHIGSEEGRQLIAALQEEMGGPQELDEYGPTVGTLEFHPGVSYRNLAVFRPEDSAPFTDTTDTRPRHAIPDQPILNHLPKGPGSQRLIGLMEHSVAVLRDHPVNKARVAAGQRPATHIWLWGQGQAPTLRPFQDV